MGTRFSLGLTVDGRGSRHDKSVDSILVTEWLDETRQSQQKYRGETVR